MNSRSWQLDTPAKINLSLRIVGRRPDGYHDLETVFLPLPELADRVTIVPAPGEPLTLRCAAPGVPAGEENLAWRAAAAFAKFAKLKPAWRISVRKRIPVAAGLGGGSSDAGAVLRLLHQIHPVLTDADLLRLATNLGADVPFFLAPEPAIGRGIGEELLPLKIRRPLPVVLVFPGFPISTTWAYQHWRPDPADGALDPLCAALAAGNPAQVAANLANDLAPAAMAKFPLLQIIRAQMMTNGALGTGMSGSGPTLFAICPDLPAARRLAIRLQRRCAVTAMATLAG